MLWLVLFEWKELFKCLLFMGCCGCPCGLYFGGGGGCGLEAPEFWLLRKTDKRLLLVHNCSLLR